jgi:hypothetical protein
VLHAAAQQGALQVGQFEALFDLSVTAEYKESTATTRTVTDSDVIVVTAAGLSGCSGLVGSG